MARLNARIEEIGCRFFDHTQSKETADAISMRGLVEIARAWQRGDLHARLWLMLHEAGRIAPSPIEARARMRAALYKALVVTWLFAGLRVNEILRLRVGCIRWQREDAKIQGSDESLSKDAVCFLDVPINKTGGAFSKPVDRAVGEAIAAWEKVRPDQPMSACERAKSWLPA
jgi:hypothetical protein